MGQGVGRAVREEEGRHAEECWSQLPRGLGCAEAATTKCWFLSSRQGGPMCSSCCTPPPRNASPLCLRSPHPVKPLSAGPAEGSPDRKQSRSSLSTALSSGLEKLKTVTAGSVQPVAPAPQVGQTVDTKRLKVRPGRMPEGVRPDTWCCGERSGAPRSGAGCWAGWSKEQARSPTPGP